MNHTFSTCLAGIAGSCPPELVSPTALQRLHGTGEALPAPLARSFYLECRLGPGEAVDVVVGVTEQGRAILAGTDPAVCLPRRMRAHPQWEAVRRLCTRWADPGSPPGSLVQGMWLEFDAPDAGRDTAVPLPSVFLKLAPSALAGAGAVEGLLVSLPGVSASPQVVCALRRCLGALPAAAHVAYLGSFTPRGTDAVRLCLAGIGEDALPGYLARMDWPGDPRALESFLHEVSTTDGRRLHHGPGMLHVDVGEDGVQPRIGLEYVLERGGQIRGRLHETGFLQRLVELGLCTTAKRDGLLTWPGYSFEDFVHELWPSLVKRRVNHLKLVYQDARAPEAKAYLCTFSEFYPRRPHTEEHHGRAAPAAV